ncbi:YfbU family protein [Achromobacter mucicolens]|uniref:YfbU family protein n=1 Tax=Achromobacter mucicolens TaxID=1389922 RepID=UPI0021D34275|nr:YfbU family protein [Achromobacter mucicolens]MCU6618544.1 YfbU family protein [Achromobacter mucicolens]
MEISQRDRLMLINQYKILASLNKDEADHYNELISILENGYKVFYSQLDEWISDEMPEEQGRFVLDVLDLYRAIEDIKRATKDDRLLGHRYSFFPGFDGNNETAHMGFCRFLIETQGKFQEQKQYLLKNDNLNSHMPMIEKYIRMLEEAKNLPNKWRMSVDEALRVLEA